VLPVTPWVN